MLSGPSRLWARTIAGPTTEAFSAARDFAIESEWEVRRNTHPAAIGPEEAAAIERQNQARAHGPRDAVSAVPRKYLLTSIVFCDVCGGPMVGDRGSYSCAWGRRGVNRVPEQLHLLRVPRSEGYWPCEGGASLSDSLRDGTRRDAEGIRRGVVSSNGARRAQQERDRGDPRADRSAPRGPLPRQGRSHVDRGEGRGSRHGNGSRWKRSVTESRRSPHYSTTPSASWPTT